MELTQDLVEGRFVRRLNRLPLEGKVAMGAKVSLYDQVSVSSTHGDNRNSNAFPSRNLPRSIETAGQWARNDRCSPKPQQRVPDGLGPEDKHIINRWPVFSHLRPTTENRVYWRTMSRAWPLTGTHAAFFDSLGTGLHHQSKLGLRRTPGCPTLC